MNEDPISEEKVGIYSRVARRPRKEENSREPKGLVS